MKNKINRLLAAVLALVMTVSMMQPMALNAFADGGNPDGPIDLEAQCGICGHMAMSHMGVQMANDRIDGCMGCMMDPEMGGDCQCRDKTWAECADGGLTEIPTTLNGLSVTWPKGTYLSRGQVCCPHRDDGILKGDVFYGWDGVWPVDQLTADTYRVCFQGCEIVLSDVGPTDPTVAVTSVTIDKETASMTVGGDTLTLTATVYPENADNKNVSWASNNTGVATVANGVVTAVAPGEATITVKTVDGEFTDSCVVTIVNGDAQFAAEVDALIDAIGTVEFTDASKGKIDAARTAYDALTDAQKALVTKLDVLTAAETAYDNLKAESEAAAALAQAKADAKAAVEAAADGHTSANVVAAIDAAKAAIDAAASLDEVNTAKTKGVAAVNNVKHSYKETGKYSWANVDDNFAMSYEAACEECHKVTIKQAAVEKEASEGYVTYTATTDEGKIYTKKVLETIVVTYNDEPYEYDYLEIVKLESDEKVDWYADGVLVSTAAKQYAFAATKNVTITTKEATVAKPIVTISSNNRVWDASAGKYVFTYTTNWSVPEGYTFVKGGFIYRYGAANYGQIDRDTVFAKGTTVNSSLKVKYGTFDYTLKMSTSYATRDMFGIGFIVVKDQKGVEQTIYSDTMAINHAIG